MFHSIHSTNTRASYVARTVLGAEKALKNKTDRNLVFLVVEMLCKYLKSMTRFNKYKIILNNIYDLSSKSSM